MSLYGPKKEIDWSGFEPIVDKTPTTPPKRPGPPPVPVSLETIASPCADDLGRAIEFLRRVGEVLDERGREYGDSVFRPGIFGQTSETMCLARLGDKINRLRAHCYRGTDDADTLLDIAGYTALLYSIRTRGV